MDLNNRQKEAVQHPGGPLLIAAGAGSGKTRTLTARIAHLVRTGVRPDSILAITFTNKAADEMKRRIHNLGFRIHDSGFKIQDLFVGTFHSFGARILRAEARYFKRTPDFTIFDEDDVFSLIKQVARGLNLPKEKYQPAAFRKLISDIKNELGASADITDNDSRLNPELITAAHESYEALLVKNNAFDFDDLIEKPVRLFQEHPHILEKYQRRYEHILIDEYQDINTAQCHLVRLLAYKHKNVTVVGDDAQSIYRFRHADFRNFLNFERDWPSAKVVLLEENYRSTPTILQAANHIIQNNTHQKHKTLWTNNPNGEPITVYAAEDENDEAEWIVENIATIATSQVANLENTTIVYRTNAQSRALEQALIANEIPYRIFGGIRFYERKEIKDIVAGLRFAHNPRDTVSAERIMKNFSKSKSAVLLTNLPRMAKQQTILQLIDYFIATTRYIDYLTANYTNAEDRIENIQELIAFADGFVDGATVATPKSLASGLSAFLERVSLAQGHDNSQGKRGVNVMTIHLSKGLEFETVFIAGCSEGVLPHHRSYGSIAELEEERRLMYVAVTRAAKRLYISFSNTPSRFLYEIPGTLIKFVNAPSSRRRIATLPDEEDLWLEYE